MRGLRQPFHWQALLIQGAREIPLDRLDVLPPKAEECLRDYQRELIGRIAVELRAGHTRILAQAPTGAGKTDIIAAIVMAAVSSGLRVLVIATRARLVRQIHERLAAFDVRHGAIAAPLPALVNHSAPVTAPRTDKVVETAVAEVIGLDDAATEVILKAHNDARQKYGAPPLEYHKNLARIAQPWANHLVGLYAEGSWPADPHNPGAKGKVGENIHRIGAAGQYKPGSIEPDHTKPVLEWLSEVKNYNLESKVAKYKNKQYLHFTQLVWKATTTVGCGFALIYLPDGSFKAVWVCNYLPAGNTQGEFKNNT
jgi:hypothetical protein